MEPQVEIYCKKEKDRKKDCSCLWLILALVAIALSFFVGVLVAALTGIVATLGIGAIIALIVILAVLLVIAIINVICCLKKDKKNAVYTAFFLRGWGAKTRPAKSKNLAVSARFLCSD